MARLAAALAALLLLSFLAACGDDEESTTVTETEVETAEGTTVAESETGEETTGPGAPPAPNQPGKSGPAFFSTPTGNIGCHIASEFVRCDIAKRSWKPTPSPEPCELDYGQGIALEVGRGAEFVCAGDTALGAPTVLGYGERTQRGPIFCDSTEEGVTCSDLVTGAGFFISRESYRIF